MLTTGLVGAGPWAEVFHAPMLAAGPDTSLATVWARRHDAASAIASAHGASASGSFEELLATCDAVAFAVPPDVQAALAVKAAAAGKHLLLEKPLGFTLDEAERLADAAGEAGVRSVLMLRNRFSDEGRRFVAEATTHRARGAQARFVSGGSVPGAFFATPWRVARGALLDLAPHALDLLDAAMGPIGSVTATGDPTRWVALTTEHEGGGISQVALSITTPRARGLFRVEVTTDEGSIDFDGGAADADESVPGRIAAALATAAATGEPHEIDIRRGLYLQRLIDQAERSLAER